VIDFDFSTDSQPQAGSLLISEPFLDDDYFSRAVIYLCDHDDNTGSFGFVLNKYVETNLSEAVKGFPSIDFKVSVGGPVDTSNLFYIHNFGDALSNSQLIHGDLSIGGDFNEMKEMISKIPGKAKEIRFFIGYSGWEKGQLESEIEENSWVVINNIPSSVILNTESESLWKDLMIKLGGKFKLMSKFPINPSDN
jgi:putative transcriptional regulator